MYKVLLAVMHIVCEGKHAHFAQIEDRLLSASYYVPEYDGGLSA
jgi:hypothetical protein